MGFYRFFRRFCAIVLKPVFFYRVLGRGGEPDGGCLVCANHTSITDPVFVGIALDTRREIRFMAKVELFKNKLFAWFLRSLGAFPVRRGEADIGAIKCSLKTIKDGGRLMLFPEGTRGGDEAKAGAGMLALRTGCPVLPIYVSPKKRAFRRVWVVVGEPFFPAKTGASPAEANRAAAEEIMERVYALAEKIPGKKRR